MINQNEDVMFSDVHILLDKGSLILINWMVLITSKTSFLRVSQVG